MTDKETLILAAKAAGNKPPSGPYEGYVRDDGTFIYYMDCEGKTWITWNTLNDNNDCFMLETSMKLTIVWREDCVESRDPEGFFAREYFKDHNGNKDKARRYASTMAAALRGRE